MPQLQEGHQLQLLQGGGEFFPALLEACAGAQSEIWFETYIINADASGQAVCTALAAASRRGVAVRLVADGAGTPEMPQHLAAELTAAGVHWRVYQPLMGLGWLVPGQWRRLHRKLCVVDAQVAFCGGINVLDDLSDPNHGQLDAPRFDFAVRVQGPLVHDVLGAVQVFWHRMEAVDAAGQAVRRGSLPQRVAGLQGLAGEALREGQEFFWITKTGKPTPALSQGTGSRAALLLRDNFRHRARIEKAYLKAIGDAQRDIVIANAYFVPGRKLRTALTHAARRGVRVRLLVQGKYEYFMQDHAARAVWGSLLSAGVEIHKYEASFLHAKVAVVDQSWATVGSSNLDPLSLLLAREANVVVQDAAFSQELRRRLELAIEQGGQQVELSSHLNRPRLQRALDYLALGLMRVMLWLAGKRY